MTVASFHDLTLADRDRKWDSAAAERRVRRWAGAEDGPNDRYRKAFLWYDEDKKDEFTAYKLPIADAIDGKLKVVPRAVMAAAGVVEGARRGVDLPKGDVTKVKRVIQRYYEKIGEDVPWHTAA